MDEKTKKLDDFHLAAENHKNLYQDGPVLNVTSTPFAASKDPSLAQQKVEKSESNLRVPSYSVTASTFYVIAISTVLALSYEYIPEFPRFGIAEFIYAQIKPLSLSSGNTVFSVFMFIALVCSYISSLRKFTGIAGSVIYLGVLIGLLASLISVLLNSSLKISGVGTTLIIILFSINAYSLISVFKIESFDGYGNSPQQKDSLLLDWFKILLLVVSVGPASFALGRKLNGNNIHAIATSDDPNYIVISNISSIWLWFSGFSLFLMFFFLLKAVSSGNLRQSAGKIFAALLIVSIYFTYISPTTSAKSQQWKQDLTSTNLADAMDRGCSTWSFQRGESVYTINFDGSLCNDASIYVNGVYYESKTYNADLKNLSDVTKLVDGADDKKFLSNSYGDKLIISAENSDNYGGFIVLNIPDFSLRNEIYCPDGGEHTIRFSSDKPDDVEAHRLTFPGDPHGIFLACNNVTNFFDPSTL